MGRLSKRVGENRLLKMGTKVRVYVACVVSTLLYGSETWTTYFHQERRLNTFHIRCLMQIMGITWRDKIPNSEVLRWAKVPSMYTPC